MDSYKLSISTRIVGSGLLAKAFLASADKLSNVCIYAAGVSNSSCDDPFEFRREKMRLLNALTLNNEAYSFVYFSTCSVAEPTLNHSPYIRHKIEMEQLVKQHPNFIIVRLSQVVGHTPNPHTLLNFLYARISRGEKFAIWKNAIRNVIDVDDVAAIVTQFVKNNPSRSILFNVANPISYPIINLVDVMEKVIGKPAITDIIDKYSAYEIDTSKISDIITELHLSFDDAYLLRVIQKYYGERKK